MDLRQRARELPSSPGVYLFKNAEGEVVYVGKAKDLRARTRNYFLAGQYENAKTGSLLRVAVDLETIVVDSEAEALALENTLIKKLQPRFNVLLRDDKTYPYIRLSAEKYPRVYVTRRLVQDGSEYFGPFFPAGFAWRLVDFVHKHFLVPSCKIDLTRAHPRPCLQFHIQRCLGPCVAGLTTEEAYARAVHDTRLFLAGRHADLAVELRRRRDEAAAAERFEEAAGLRDRLTVLEDMRNRQKMHAVEGEDADIAGLYREGERAALHLFHLRHGRIVDRREFFWEELPELEGGELVGALLKQIYLGQPYVPPLILVPADFEDRALLAAELSRQRGGAVNIAIPQRGSKSAMLALANRNAAQSFQRRFRQPADANPAWLPELAAAFGLPAPPARIDCFDISHFQGAETVASMVVWAPGGMQRSQYRKFRIRTVTGVDDFKSMEEVITRRYRRAVAGEAPLPGLVLVDGGLGQLHAARRALGTLGLDSLPLAAIAKREELIYVSGRESTPLRLDPSSPVLRLIQMIRDESHRFAITFHRQRRGRSTLQSRLLEVPGIGPASVRRLLGHFGSLAAVQSASEDRLREVLPAAKASRLAEFVKTL